MVVVLRCKDRWRRDVELTDSCWVDHVLRRRPYFLGCEGACVGDTLQHPTFVNHDVDFADRECFYRPSPLPPPHQGFLVKVVVAYRFINGADQEGTVVTVHLTANPKPGENRKWP